MRLPKDLYWGNLDLGGMLLGLYENQVSELIFQSFYDRKLFIDIGAADGYFGIGVLYAGRCEKSICFELESDGREKIIENWKLNNSPGKLEVYGDIFTQTDHVFQNIDFNKTIILVDIEGAEFELFNRDFICQIRNAVVVLEIHHWVDEFIDKYQNLLQNVSEYFEITILERSEQSTLEIPDLQSFTDDNRLLLQSESRPGNMRFLLFKPKNVN